MRSNIRRKGKQAEPITTTPAAMPTMMAPVCTGPRCSRCGSGDVTLLESGAYFGGRTRRKLSCRRCRRAFTIIVSALSDASDEEKPIEFHFGKPQMCEACQVYGRVYNNRGALRYVKCPDCGQTWKELGTEVERE